MKNKREFFTGILVIVITVITMIFSLYYSTNLLKQNAEKSSVPIFIDRKDPKYKIQNWGMNRSRTKKQALEERMTYN